MASLDPHPDVVVPTEVDDPMSGQSHQGEDEGEQIVPMEDDSSEEEEDDPEDLRKVAQGFIVDEDEEEEEEEDDEKREDRRRKKHRKHKRRRGLFLLSLFTQYSLFSTARRRK